MFSKDLLHKLVLGTVQLGLEYGINNRAGKPTREQSLTMLKEAYEGGITTFDTAYAYGNAEELLGIFHKEHGLEGTIQVITKLKPNILSEEQGLVYEIIKSNLLESLKRLQLPFVNGYLLHTPEYIRDTKVVETLCKLKGEGLVKNIGVSIYEEEDALYAAQLKEVDYIQVPYSIFDQRLDRTNFFALAQKNKKKIFARSAFLQGLFFMEEKKIPPHLNKVKFYLKKLDEIIAPYGLSRHQAALLFSLRNNNIDYTVFGVDNNAQLKENMQLAQAPIDFDACRKKLQKNFSDIERNIILPSLWKK